MESWREELYLQHGWLSDTVSRVKVGVRNTANRVGSKTNSDGTWKQHKYIRKEGNRYIYPQDLKKTATNMANKVASTVKKAATNAKTTIKTNKKDSVKVDVDNDRIKQTYTDKYYGHGQNTLNRYMPDEREMTEYLYKTTPNTLISERSGQRSFKYSKKTENDIRDAHGSDNKIREEREIYEGPNLGWDNTFFSSDVRVVNGERWFKSEIDVNVAIVTHNRGSGGLTKSTAATYTITYSKTRQLLNKGKAFIESLKKKKR